MYAGMRNGGLRALRVDDVDPAAGVIRVERGWDEKEGEIEAKSAAGKRKVPIPGALRDTVIEHVMSSGRARIPAHPRPYRLRRLQREGVAGPRRHRVAQGGLNRITPHQCRHAYASLMIGAGVNAKALSTFMGHSSIQVTYDRYGHLLSGSEDEAAELLDAYLNAQLEAQEDRARGAGADLAGAQTGAQPASESAGSAWLSGQAYPMRSRIGISWICGGWRWSHRMPLGRP
jgi:integrase